jgi:hypothetical protein
VAKEEVRDQGKGGQGEVQGTIAQQRRNTALPLTCIRCRSVTLHYLVRKLLQEGRASQVMEKQACKRERERGKLASCKARRGWIRD